VWQRIAPSPSNFTTRKKVEVQQWADNGCCEPGYYYNPTPTALLTLVTQPLIETAFQSFTASVFSESKRLQGHFLIALS